MTAVRLKRAASLVTGVETAERLPHVGLEDVATGGGLQDAASLAEIEPLPGGMAEAAVGDVLFGKLRPYLQKSVRVDRPLLVSPELLVLRPGSRIHPGWFAYLVASRPFADWAVASSEGTKMPRTSWEKLGDFIIDLPDIHAQLQIADFLDAQTARIDALIAKKDEMIRLLGEREHAYLSSVLMPNDAGWSRLRHLAWIQSGITVDGSREGGTLHPYLRVANVQPGWLDLSEVTQIALSPHVARRYRLRRGDVLMTEGGDLDKLGRGTVWNDEIPGCLHQNHVFAVRPDPQLLDSTYLALLSMTAHARAYFERTGTRTTNLASTNVSKVGEFQIPAISIEAQRSLADRCSAARRQTIAARQKLERQIDLLREHRQALITAAVTGELSIP